jgi:crotonobetainyl-CoA:carnitine CoA-transferase CaiB-like acyl-CoA transferase
VARTGFPDREPVLPPLALADSITGLYGAFATVTALRAREHGARGQIIVLSLLESMFSVFGPEAAVYRFTSGVKERAGSGSNISSPRNVYRCRDGTFVAVSGSTQAMARRIFAVIGRAEMIDDTRFCTNAARVKHRIEVDEAVGASPGPLTPSSFALHIGKELHHGLNGRQIHWCWHCLHRHGRRRSRRRHHLRQLSSVMAKPKIRFTN